jgi:hypothetical protein
MTPNVSLQIYSPRRTQKHREEKKKRNDIIFHLRLDKYAAIHLVANKSVQIPDTREGTGGLMASVPQRGLT